MEYFVSKAGDGQYTSIQAAINAIPEGTSGGVTIHVAKGIYAERVVVNRDTVCIKGEDAAQTVISGGLYALMPMPGGTQRGTFRTATLLVTGGDVTIEDVTIENTAGDGRLAGQAVAVYAAGDRAVFRGCWFLGAQDTLFCGPTMPKVAQDVLPSIIPPGVESVGDCPPVQGRQYYERCWIQGDIDFIFGPYACWFEQCTLYCNERGGYYTAANTPAENSYGFVFHACTFTGACPPGGAYLGRPWREHAATVFLCCTMDTCVNPLGYADWDSPFRPVTQRYGEYGTEGARSDLTARHPAAKRLSKAEADAITIACVLAGEDGWNPVV